MPKRFFKKTMSILLSCLVVLETACASAPPPQPVVYHPPVQSLPAKQRPPLVLMPLRTSGEVAHTSKEVFETSLSEELGKYYTVYAGKRVAAKVDEVFARRSEEAKEGEQCDDTKCLRDVANEFQAEYVAISSISHQAGGYLLSLNIQDIVEDKMVYSKSEPCKGCDEYEIVDKLKTLAQGSGLFGSVATAPAVQPAPPPVQEESNWWKWALGILIVGGVAAAAAGGAGSSSSSSSGGGSSSSTGNISVSW
ncbi:MAG: hypothetical protein HZA04_10010 [Nitrospinae bacterium]|nr:hypothetical protein [Nitrospinota bacterium]